jgi:hypothetical protein
MRFLNHYCYSCRMCVCKLMHIAACAGQLAYSRGRVAQIPGPLSGFFTVKLLSTACHCDGLMMTVSINQSMLHLSCPPHGAFLWGNGIVIVRLAEWPVPLWGLSEG